MDRVIIKNSQNLDEKSIKFSQKANENDTKKKKKRMVQPFKMEKDYNSNIRNMDNNNVQQYHDDWRTLEMTPRTGAGMVDNNDYEEILENIIPELIEVADIDEWHDEEKPEEQTHDYPGSSGSIWGFIVITISKENIEKIGYSFEDIKNAIESNKEYLDSFFWGYEKMGHGDDIYFEEQKSEIEQDENGNMIIQIPYEASYPKDQN